MNPRRQSWIVALVICLGLAFGVAQGALAAPLGDHLPQTKNPTSARFDMAGSISTSGGTIPINGTGAASGSDFMLDMEMQAPAGASGPDRISINLVAVGSKLYFKMAGLDPETDDKWFVTDIPPTGMDGMGVLTGLDMQALHDAVKITSTAKEEVNGAPTTRYNIEVDTKALMPPGSEPAEEGVSLETTVTGALWVGETDMYIHKFMVVSESIATVGETTSFARIELTVIFTEFDAPVTITPPANAEPLDIESGLSDLPMGGLLGDLAGATPGGSSEMPTGMPTTGSGAPDSSWPLALLGIGAATLASGVAIRRRAAR